MTDMAGSRGVALRRQVESVAPGTVRVCEAENRPLRAGEVRVAISYAGICGSDLHAIERSRRTSEGGPLVPGHEQSGIVTELGPGVLKWEVGARVVVLPRVACGMCALCRRGRPMNCRAFARPRTGGWATEMMVDSRFLVPIPESLDLRTAALAEPMACALRAIDRSKIMAGSAVLVLGAGPLGLLLCGLLQRSGATHVLVSEPHAARRAMAQGLGAIVFDPESGALPDWVDEVTAGQGVDVVFEVAGLARTVEQAVEVVNPAGTVVIVGVADPLAEAAVRPFIVFERELTIAGAWGIESTITRALDCLAATDLDQTITREFHLEDVEHALAAARGGAGKVLLVP